MDSEPKIVIKQQKTSFLYSSLFKRVQHECQGTAIILFKVYHYTVFFCSVIAGSELGPLVK